jgi:putative PIN family toxin of toxin-antitoxin system
MSDAAMRTVLDCMVYAQALINPRGPAGECLARGAKGEFVLVVSEYVLSEIRELPAKLPAKFAITDHKITALLDELIPVALLVSNVPHIFDHPIDPDDSAYVDLAVAAGAKLIVSRDRHLLGLKDPMKPWSEEFRRRFPDLNVLTVEELLAQLREAQGPPDGTAGPSEITNP